MLDLPVPLFPRMPVMPSWNLISSCRNLLKFFRTSRSMIIEWLRNDFLLTLLGATPPPRGHPPFAMTTYYLFWKKTRFGICQ